MDEYCINLSRYYTQCRPGAPNPFQGAITFDNILLAWVAIFQVISLEGWADIMYIVQDSHSFYDFFYFVLLIVVRLSPSLSKPEQFVFSEDNF